MPPNVDLLRRFMAEVWDRGDLTAIDRYVGDTYEVRSDPGDPWDGQTLSREGFRQRVAISREPFPDLRFELGDMVADGDRVAVCWVMHGTNSGPFAGRPPSGRVIRVHGHTLYYFANGRITGHRQVVDRLAVARQVGLLG